jgi:hypothetical protein
MAECDWLLASLFTCRVSTMRHAQFIAAKLVAFAERDRPKPRKSIFRIISQALHHSRRLQAESIIRQYHHLLAAEPSDSKPKVGGQ